MLVSCILPWRSTLQSFPLEYLSGFFFQFYFVFLLLSVRGGSFETGRVKVCSADGVKTWCTTHVMPQGGKCLSHFDNEKRIAEKEKL